MNPVDVLLFASVVLFLVTWAAAVYWADKEVTRIQKDGKA